MGEVADSRNWARRVLRRGTGRRLSLHGHTKVHYFTISDETLSWWNCYRTPLCEEMLLPASLPLRRRCMLVGVVVWFQGQGNHRPGEGGRPTSINLQFGVMGIRRKDNRESTSPSSTWNHVRVDLSMAPTPPLLVNHSSKRPPLREFPLPLPTT